MLVLSRKPGERLVLTMGGHQAYIEILTTARGRVRIGIDAPPHVKVRREELCRRMAADPLREIA
jgi:carbon storage regulator CsrA